jgi:hypothetical protein
VEYLGSACAEPAKYFGFRIRLYEETLSNLSGTALPFIGLDTKGARASSWFLESTRIVLSGVSSVSRVAF